MRAQLRDVHQQRGVDLITERMESATLNESCRHSASSDSPRTPVAREWSSDSNRWTSPSPLQSDYSSESASPRPPLLPGTTERCERISRAYALQQAADETTSLRGQLAQRHRELTTLIRPLGNAAAEVQHAESRAHQELNEIQ